MNIQKRHIGTPEKHPWHMKSIRCSAKCAPLHICRLWHAHVGPPSLETPEVPTQTMAVWGREARMPQADSTLLREPFHRAVPAPFRVAMRSPPFVPLGERQQNTKAQLGTPSQEDRQQSWGCQRPRGRGLIKPSPLTAVLTAGGPPVDLLFGGAHSTGSPRETLMRLQALWLAAGCCHREVIFWGTRAGEMGRRGRDAGCSWPRTLWRTPHRLTQEVWGAPRGWGASGVWGAQSLGGGAGPVHAWLSESQLHVPLAFHGVTLWTWGLELSWPTFPC